MSRGVGTSSKTYRSCHQHLGRSLRWVHESATLEKWPDEILMFDVLWSSSNDG